jgi:outer membrane protein assembly factor BamA
VPLQAGADLDVDDPAIEQIRWRLMGTGWFDDVHLRLERGSRRGWVVLVVDVEERNTLVISRVVAGLSRVVTSSTSRDDRLRPYGGLGVTETNLFGLGIGLGASVVAAEDQLGLDLRYHDPMAVADGFDLRGRAFYNDAREFFGREPLVAIDCPPVDPEDDNPDDCDPDVELERAVVIYDRVGAGIGTGHDLTSSIRYELDWLGEMVQVDALPRAASTLIGPDGAETRAPIDFGIDDGTTYVSSLHLGLVLDARDDPALPSRGQLLRLDARIASRAFGSTYDFARYEVDFQHFQRLPWGHVVELRAFLGSVVGRAPFFYNFYAADLSDLLPSRALELNVDHRRTHNLLKTAIRDSDKEEIAARVAFEYQLPLHRGGGDVRGVDVYLGAGLFMLADKDQLRTGTGYDGLSRLPVDLTFDLGLRADTVLGLFKFGFSSLIGFLPDLGQDQ